MWYTTAQKTLQNFPVGLCLDYAHGQYAAQVWAVTHPEGVGYVLAEHLARTPEITAVALLVWEPKTSSTQTGRDFKSFLYRRIHARGYWYEKQEDADEEILAHDSEKCYSALSASAIRKILGEGWWVGQSETSSLGAETEGQSSRWHKFKGRMWDAAAPWGDVWISDVAFLGASELEAPNGKR